MMILGTFLYVFNILQKPFLFTIYDLYWDLLIFLSIFLMLSYALPIFNRWNTSEICILFFIFLIFSIYHACYQLMNALGICLYFCSLGQDSTVFLVIYTNSNAVMSCKNIEFTIRRNQVCILVSFNFRVCCSPFFWFLSSWCWLTVALLV